MAKDDWNPRKGRCADVSGRCRRNSFSLWGTFYGETSKHNIDIAGATLISSRRYRCPPPRDALPFVLLLLLLLFFSTLPNSVTSPRIPLLCRAPKAQITRAFVAWASDRTRVGFLQLHAPLSSPASRLLSLFLHENRSSRRRRFLVAAEFRDSGR